jgi:hypothetical protein
MFLLHFLISAVLMVSLPFLQCKGKETSKWSPRHDAMFTLKSIKKTQKPREIDSWIEEWLELDRYRMKHVE